MLKKDKEIEKRKKNNKNNESKYNFKHLVPLESSIWDHCLYANISISL